MKTTEINITELELKVLSNIRNSEYLDVQKPEELINYPTWSFAVTKSYSGKGDAMSLRGAMGSCVKKGLIKCDNSGTDDETCAMTELGVKVLTDHNLF